MQEVKKEEIEDAFKHDKRAQQLVTMIKKILSLYKATVSNARINTKLIQNTVTE